MNFIAYLRSLGARFFRRAKIDNELEEELGAHIRLHADRLERAGLDRAEAERRARIEFGSTARFQAKNAANSSAEIFSTRSSRMCGSVCAH